MSVRTWFIAVACVFGCLGVRAQQRGPGGDAWMKYSEKLGFAANYSVTMEMEAGGHMMSFRTARLAPRTRTEMEMPRMGKMITIMDLDEANDKGGKGVSYMLFPATKTYTKTALTPGAPAEQKTEADVQIEELGKETVDGMACAKRRLTVTDPDTKQRHVMLFWTAAAVRNMPVRIEMSENGVTSIMRFKDYDFSKPPADLFVVPKDYTPGGMFPGMGMPAGAAVDPAVLKKAQQDAAADAAAAAAAQPPVPPPNETAQTPQEMKDVVTNAVKETTKSAVREGIDAGFRRLFGR